MYVKATNDNIVIQLTKIPREDNDIISFVTRQDTCIFRKRVKRGKFRRMKTVTLFLSTFLEQTKTTEEYMM